MKLTIQHLQQKFDLELLAGEEGLEHPLTVVDIKRPGIELAGYWEYFTPKRIQLMGMTELAFIKGFSEKECQTRLEEYFSYPMPGVIITRGLEPPKPMIGLAEQANIPLLRTQMSTTRFSSRLSDYLERELAPTQTIHSVLVDVYGVGVLLMGESGIGKSETALELVKRGHRLVADDLVELRKIGEMTLIGKALKINQHYMELRGIGIIDVKTLFGAGAIKIEQEVHLVVVLEGWERSQVDAYDRLGLTTERKEILGIDVPKVVIPVRPGRNLTTIIEVAAMNHRLKYMGYHAAQEFAQRLEEEIARKKELNP